MFELVPFRKDDLIKRGDLFDQMIDSFFNDDFMIPSVFNNNPFRADMKENEHEYIIEADLPGIKKEAINIEYKNNYLNVSAKKENSTEEKNGNYVRKERRSGEFKRSFYIDGIEENKIDASFKDGVLKIILPKNQKEINGKRKIKIN